MKANRECKVCGKKYYFCPNCNSNLANPQPKWMINYCCEDCKTVFDVAVKYNLKQLDKAEASSILSGLDLSNVDSYEETVRDVVKELTSHKKSHKNEETKVVEPKTEELIKFDVME